MQPNPLALMVGGPSDRPLRPEDLWELVDLQPLDAPGRVNWHGALR